ncbi:hypothetical protein BDV18DRAFT_164585 [Aspergillus unguis]
MLAALSKAARLKPEVRLGQAISQFQADLSTQQKATFNKHQARASVSPPGIRDVMQLIAEINQSGERCFGPRVTSLLQAVQQFAALGDIVVGGTQNILACGVWSLVRMTLLVVVKHSAYFERLSLMLMSIGRSAPRYQAMGAIYAKSSELKSSMLEYFIVVVQLCHHVLRLSRKSALGQWASTLNDSTINSFQTGLELWATSIKEEVNALMAQRLAMESHERTWFKSQIGRRSDQETHSNKVRTKQRILDACSTYDHESAWKQIRKLGNVSLLKDSDVYRTWRGHVQPCTLVCAGKLGSGKSVLLANIVDDLYLHGVENTPVLYFFSQHDTTESLTARTVIGSLARQISQVLVKDPENVIGMLPDSDCMEIKEWVRFLKRLVPQAYRAYFILDGLGHCDPIEQKSVLAALQALQNIMNLSVCVSTRSETSIFQCSSENLINGTTLSMPKDNPDIDAFVNTELKRCIESDKLSINDPSLILEIQETLSREAQGMFLWAALQIKALCLERTDANIRAAIAHLPKKLSDVYSLILSKVSEGDIMYQKRVFELIVAARRPLLAEEMREALSIIPGNVVWDPCKLLNDLNSALSSCGDLVTVDEEDGSIRMVHHSVRTFLLRNYLCPQEFSLHSAQKAMGEIVVTYLNYEVFSKQVSSSRAPQIRAESLTSSVVNAVTSSLRHDQSKKLALKLLDLGKDMGKGTDQQVNQVLVDVMDRRKRNQVLTPLDFYHYASVWWPSHVGHLEISNTTTLKHFQRLLDWISPNVVDGNGRTALSYAAEYGEPEVVDILLKNGASDQTDAMGLTPLLRAVLGGRVDITLLDKHLSK